MSDESTTEPTEPTENSIVDAGAYRLLFGEFRFKTLAQVAESASGLLYLANLLNYKNTYPRTRANIDAFLKEPAVAAPLEAARLADRSARKGRRTRCRETHADRERAKEYGMS